MSFTYNRKRDAGYQPLSGSPPQHGSGPLLLGPRVPSGTNLHRRTISPGPSSERRHTSAPRTRTQATIAPGQPVPTNRQRDKFIPLPEDPDEGEGELPPEQFAGLSPGPPASPPLDLPITPVPLPVPNLFEDLPPQQLVQPAMLEAAAKRGRITVYCVAESFDRKRLHEFLIRTFEAGRVVSYPDALYLQYTKGSEDQPGGDVFYFDYGVLACWGLTRIQETAICRGIPKDCQSGMYKAKLVELDEFVINYTTLEKPNIQNDTVTLHRRSAKDHKIKLAISYALCQSTKLSVYEKRVVDMVLETRNLPEALAETGRVHVSAVQIAKLIGKVFLQKSEVNLLSSVLDVPEFFWRAPDSYQVLYESITEYVELDTRVEVLNSRFQVLTEMLDMLRSHQNNHHNTRLEWIVIWLIVVECVVGVMEVLGLFGLVGGEGA